MEPLTNRELLRVLIRMLVVTGGFWMVCILAALSVAALLIWGIWKIRRQRRGG